MAYGKTEMKELGEGDEAMYERVVEEGEIGAIRGAEALN
jgi:hypothetical protein